MDLLKKFGKAVDRAAGALVDKQRVKADLNRLRMVIRCEERAAEKEYLALGRYYYNTLRDKNNPVAEAHCAQLDEIEQRLENALSMMRACSESNFIGTIRAPGGAPCPCDDGECEEIDLSDVESYDQDPCLEAAPLAGPEKPQEQGEENEDLPFEG